jgi:hypothetical protein
MPNRAWISTRKGLFELTKTNGKWAIDRVHFLGDPVVYALPDARDGAIYAALNLGHYGAKLHRRDLGTDRFTEISVPEYPAKPEGFVDENEWKLQCIWSLAAGGSDEPGVLWAGTLPGGLFRSSDRGATWQLMRGLWDQPSRKEWFGGGNDAPGIHSICVDPRDSKHVMIAVSCGGAWATHDGGTTWATRTTGMSANYLPPERADDPAIQDPHLVAQCRAAPDQLWCQHHNGIWRSSNAGAVWEEIKNVPVSNFGFTVAVHPRDANTAWFVPGESDQRRIPKDAALAVTRTRDGGKTFDVLREGLPQQHCYDLIYRHALAVSDDGEALLMGSTTGSVWLSENGGNSWVTVSNSLPPVYAVTFEQLY